MVDPVHQSPPSLKSAEVPMVTESTSLTSSAVTSLRSQQFLLSQSHRLTHGLSSFLYLVYCTWRCSRTWLALDFRGSYSALYRTFFTRLLPKALVNSLECLVKLSERLHPCYWILSSKGTDGTSVTRAGSETRVGLKLVNSQACIQNCRLEPTRNSKAGSRARKLGFSCWKTVFFLKKPSKIFLAK